MKRYPWFLTVLTLFTILMVSCELPAPADLERQSGDLWIDPSYVARQVGDSFDVSICVQSNGQHPVGGFYLRLIYDHDLMSPDPDSEVVYCTRDGQEPSLDVSSNVVDGRTVWQFGAWNDAGFGSADGGEVIRVRFVGQESGLDDMDVEAQILKDIYYNDLGDPQVVKVGDGSQIYLSP